MTTIWKYLVIILLEKITHLTLNVGEFAFIKNTLPIKLIILKYLQEYITFEIRIGRKCCKFICLYRSSSQTNDKLESFLKTFELTFDKIHKDNPFMIPELGYFNGKSKSLMLQRVIMNYIN